MRQALFAFSTLAAASAFAYMPTPAHARDYPWCAQYSERSVGARNCGFVTFAQCQATISGVGGFCEPNPRYTHGQGRPHYKRYGPRYDRD